MTPQPGRSKSGKRQSSGQTSFVLPYKDVARLLSMVPLDKFISDLMKEIAKTYRDPKLKTMARTGWPRPPETFEVMGCQSTDYTCVKLISSNPKHGAPTVPTVTGTMVCTEFGTDEARLVCDASLLTPIRTAASTAFVMRALVPDIETLAIIGAGREGTSHGFVLSSMLKNVRQVFFFDIEPSQSRRAVTEVRRLLDRMDGKRTREIDIVELPLDERNRVYDCDAIVTATYGNEAVIGQTADRLLRDGVFIAAVGADLEGKREIDQHLYEEARFIVDDLAQSLSEGELQHAISRFELQEAKAQVEKARPTKRHRGTLMDGQIISVSDFLKSGSAFMKRSEPFTIYDSTGFSGQDLALGRLILRLLKKTKKSWPSFAWNPSRDETLGELLAAEEKSDSG